MNDDHDPIDALLRSSGQAYPPAAPPDAAHLRSVVTTSRRRARRTRGTVLAGAAALVAGGALLTVRSSDDEQADTAGVPADDTTTQPPTSAVDQLYPADVVSAFCATSPMVDDAWGDDSHVVVFWIEGADTGESSSLSMSVDGRPFFEGEIGVDGSSSLATETPAVADTTPIPGVHEVPVSTPPGEWVVGLVESLDRDAAFFLAGGSEDPPQVIAISSELFGTIEVTPTGGTIVMVERDGSTSELPLDAVVASCDDIVAGDSTPPDAPLDPPTEEEPVPTTAVATDPAVETVPPTTDPVPSTTEPADPITTTSIAPITIAPTTTSPPVNDPADPAPTTSTVPSQQVPE